MQDYQGYSQNMSQAQVVNKKGKDRAFRDGFKKICKEKILGFREEVKDCRKILINNNEEVKQVFNTQNSIPMLENPKDTIVNGIKDKMVKLVRNNEQRIKYSMTMLQKDQDWMQSKMKQDQFVDLSKK